MFKGREYNKKSKPYVYYHARFVSNDNAWCVQAYNRDHMDEIICRNKKNEEAYIKGRTHSFKTDENYEWRYLRIPHIYTFSMEKCLIVHKRVLFETEEEAKSFIIEYENFCGPLDSICPRYNRGSKIVDDNIRSSMFLYLDYDINHNKFLVDNNLSSEDEFTNHNKKLFSVALLGGRLVYVNLTDVVGYNIDGGKMLPYFMWSEDLDRLVAMSYDSPLLRETVYYKTKQREGFFNRLFGIKEKIATKFRGYYIKHTPTFLEDPLSFTGDTRMCEFIRCAYKFKDFKDYEGYGLTCGYEGFNESVQTLYTDIGNLQQLLTNIQLCERFNSSEVIYNSCRIYAAMGQSGGCHINQEISYYTKNFSKPVKEHGIKFIFDVGSPRYKDVCSGKQGINTTGELDFKYGTEAYLYRDTLDELYRIIDEKKFNILQ